LVNLQVAKVLDLLTNF